MILHGNVVCKGDIARWWIKGKLYAIIILHSDVVCQGDIVFQGDIAWWSMLRWYCSVVVHQGDILHWC